MRQTKTPAQATHEACVCVFVARRAEGMAGNVYFAETKKRHPFFD
jgi:hypothetical protein